MPKKSTVQLLKEIDMKTKFKDNEWYSIRSMLGHTWAFFYICIGGREAGKSYAVMNYFVHEWKTKGKPFIWLRLTEASTKKLLANNAAEFVDADIMRKAKLKLTQRAGTVYDHGKKMAKVLALSTFYNDKGIALYDNEELRGYNICLDEMNRERSEKRTFDINYAFVNQMENLVRSTKDSNKLRIFLIGNTLEEASDIMCSFNFIPEKFGRYKLRNKKAIIDYIPPGKRYLDRRKGTIADLLAPDASTFTNKVVVDVSLIYKGRLKKPTNIIRFDKTVAFTLWDGRVIAQYNNEKVYEINMQPYLDGVFNITNRDTIISGFHARGFYFKNLITQKMFKKELELLKPRG